MFCSVRSARIGTASPSAKSPAISASLKAEKMRPCEVGGVAATAMRLDLLHFGPAEQPRGQEYQGNGEDREGGDVLVVDREVGRPQRLDETDQEAAQYRAGERADAAQDCGGERLDAWHEAIGEVHHSVVDHEQETGHGGK